MKILHGRVKRSKPKNTAASRALDDEWQKLLARHSSPLEKGAVAKGVTVSLKSKTKVKAKKQTEPVPQITKRAPLPKPANSDANGTMPIVDPLAEAKRQLQSRIGQAYNKGGLQYLTDDELAEQRTGSHKRR